MNDTFIFFNQIAQNRRLAELERQMRGQADGARGETNRQAYLDERRQLVFTIKKELDRLQAAPNYEPKARALTLEMLREHAAVSGLSEAEFSEFIDKEYTARTLELLKLLHSESRSALTSEEWQKVVDESRRRYAAHHLGRLKTWLEIRDSLPRTPLLQRLSKHRLRFWVVLLVLAQPLLAIPYLILPEIGMTELKIISYTLWIVLALITGRELWFRSSLKNRLPDLKAKASAASGTLADEPTRENIAPVIEELTEMVRRYEKTLSLSTARKCQRAIEVLSSPHHAGPLALTTQS